MSDPKKYSQEKALATILIQHLNAQGYDYVIQENHTTPPGVADIDVFAISKSQKHDPLLIQHVSDGVFRKSLSQARIFKNDYSPHHSDTFERIKKKSDHYTQRALDYSNHTLLVAKYGMVQDDLMYRFVEDFKHKCANFFFKAIYLVSPIFQTGESRDGKWVVHQVK